VLHFLDADHSWVVLQDHRYRIKVVTLSIDTPSVAVWPGARLRVWDQNAGAEPVRSILLPGRQGQPRPVPEHPPAAVVCAGAGAGGACVGVRTVAGAPGGDVFVRSADEMGFRLALVQSGKPHNSRNQYEFKTSFSWRCRFLLSCGQIPPFFGGINGICARWGFFSRPDHDSFRINPSRTIPRECWTSGLRGGGCPCSILRWPMIRPGECAPISWPVPGNLRDLDSAIIHAHYRGWRWTRGRNVNVHAHIKVGELRVHQWVERKLVADSRRRPWKLPVCNRHAASRQFANLERAVPSTDRISGESGVILGCVGRGPKRSSQLRRAEA
jgi:hypothetical protein